MDVVNVFDDAWVDMLIDQPELSDYLVRCMGIQPDIEPGHGMGAMAPVSLWVTLGLPERYDIKFIEFVNGDTVRGWLILRAATAGFIELDGVVSLISSDEPANYEAMLDYVSSFVSNFNAAYVRKHLTGD